MNKLELAMDNVVNELDEYLRSVNGISNVDLNYEDDIVIIEYDSSIISYKMIKKEIDIFLNDLKDPNLWGFNKFFQQYKEATLCIKDLCCEYCFMRYIEDLFENDAISYAMSDFALKHTKDVRITIKYDYNLLNDNDIKAIEEKFNK